MKNLLKKLCIENINKNKENYVYSYDLKSPLESINEKQIKAIFKNSECKRIELLFNFYRFRIDLIICSKDIIHPEYSIEIYLNEKQFFNFYKELKKNYENKSNLKLDNVFVISAYK